MCQYFFAPDWKDANSEQSLVERVHTAACSGVQRRDAAACSSDAGKKP
jgi:hypothetical protein